VLLVAPPRIKAAGMAFELGYDRAAEKSVAISEHYLALATARNCPYFDAAQAVSPSDEDGVHLDAEAHGALAEAIAERVRSLL
jgi:lysophospholipase L1-like esterase